MMNEASQVPLIELLQEVPAHARHIEEDADGYGTTYNPVGRLCHEAAYEITRLRAELANALVRDIHSCHENCTLVGCVNARLRAELEQCNERMLEEQREVALAYKWLLQKVEQYGEWVCVADGAALDVAIRGKP